MEESKIVNQFKSTHIPVVDKGNQIARLNLSQGVPNPANSTDSS